MHNIAIFWGVAVIAQQSYFSRCSCECTTKLFFKVFLWMHKIAVFQGYLEIEFKGWELKWEGTTNRNLHTFKSLKSVFSCWFCFKLEKSFVLGVYSVKYYPVQLFRSNSLLLPLWTTADTITRVSSFTFLY